MSSTNATDVAVARADEVRDLEILRVTPEGFPPIAIYRVGNAFFATDDTCSHGDASLADGFLEEDCSVECPYHGGKFDIRTGLPIALPCTEPIRAYRIEERDGLLYLGSAPD
jgi:nitrite reductase/ring-hydroxylating ferredoxin subunit